MRITFRYKNMSFFSKLMLSILLLLLAGTVVYILCREPRQKDWERLLDASSYRNLSGEEIAEITLQKSVATSVTFLEKDLIDAWRLYLESMEIQPQQNKSSRDDDVNGGGRYVTITTAKGQYQLVFRPPYGEESERLLIDDVFYEFRNNTEDPFEDTYRRAAERHGEKELWNSQQ